MSKKKTEGHMLIYSDFEGFADKNDIKQYPLSECLADDDFFNSIKIFYIKRFVFRII